MATSHASSPIPYARPVEVLDPYPERSTSLGGVRQTTHLEPLRDLPGFQDWSSEAPSVFGASFDLGPFRAGRVWLPIVSVMLNVFGQGVLAAAIAYGNIDPVIGALAAIGWLVCGLTLIAAQCVTEARRRR